MAELTEKDFFSWLRLNQDNGRLSQEMVDGANELIAIVGIKKTKSILSKLNGWQDFTLLEVSTKGVEMINDFEGFRSHVYFDVANVPTIGYGSTYYIADDGSRTSVTLEDKPITEQQAHEIKKRVLNTDFAPAVNLLFADEIKAGKLSQNMFDALVSLAYNIGIRGLKGSSVYRYIKRGKFKQAGDAFLLWNKSRVHGRLTEVKGLTKRRKAERALFLA